MSEITRIPTSVEQGCAPATEELLPMVYEELGRLAVQKIASEAAGHVPHDCRPSAGRPVLP